MKYDLEILVPVSANGKYKNRLDNFKKNGIINVKDKRLLVRVAVGMEDIPNIDQGWNGLEVEVVKGPQNHVAPKVSNYYCQLDADYYDRARWFVRVDDDSITDVTSLVDSLDKEYDDKDAIYCGTCLRGDIQPADIDSLRRVNRLDLIAKKPVFHEIEANVISSSTMKRILTSQEAMDFLRFRSEVASGFCDVPLAIAARLVKVYLTEAPCITHRALVSSLSVFGGPYSHVHFVAPDIDPFHVEIVQRQVNKDAYQQPFFDKSFLAQHIDRHERRYFLEICKFLPNGLIVPRHRYYSMWSIQGDMMVIYDDECRPSIRWPIDGEYKKISGRNQYNEQILFLEVAS